MRIPLHLKQDDRSPEAMRERATLHQTMMTMTNSRGFKQVSEKTSDMSIVEKYLVEAGDMTAPTPIFTGRKHSKKYMDMEVVNEMAS